jgi:hypothetical protein
MVVVQDDAAAHDQHAHVVCLSDELPKSFGPRGGIATRVQVELQSLPHCCGSSLDVTSNSNASDERLAGLTHRPRVFLVPSLALLTQIDRLQQIGARPFDATALDRAEIRDRHSLDGRLRQEEIAHRCVGRFREPLELLQGRNGLSALPRFEFRKPSGKVLRRGASALSRPREQFRLDGSAEHESECSDRAGARRDVGQSPS